MGRDYYAILGVAKGADDNELKKGGTAAGLAACRGCVHAHTLCTHTGPALTRRDACLLPCTAYRKLAMQHHPVRGSRWGACLTQPARKG